MALLLDALIAVAVAFVGIVVVSSLFMSVGKSKKGQVPKVAKKPPPPKKSKKPHKKEEDEPISASLVGPLQTGMTTDKQGVIVHESHRNKKAAQPTPAAAKEAPKALSQKQKLDAIAKGFVPVEKKQGKKVAKDPNLVDKKTALDSKLNNFFKSGGNNRKGNKKGADEGADAEAEAVRKEGGVVSMKGKIHSADPKGYWGSQ